MRKPADLTADEVKELLDVIVPCGSYRILDTIRRGGCLTLKVKYQHKNPAFKNYADTRSDTIIMNPETYDGTFFQCSMAVQVNGNYVSAQWVMDRFYLAKGLKEVCYGSFTKHKR